MRQPEKIVTLMLILLLGLFNLTIFAQNPPPINVSPGTVQPAGIVTITTAPGATCFFQGSDGSSFDTTTSSGVIDYFANNPSGTTVAVFCQNENGTSPTATFTVVTPAIPIPDNGPPPEIIPYTELLENSPAPPDLICATNLNAELRTRPEASAPIYLFLPSFEGRDVVAQRWVNEQLWYQVAPEYMWVLASDVTSDSDQCSAGTSQVDDELVNLEEILADCPWLVDLAEELLSEEVQALFENVEDPCGVFDALTYEANFGYQNPLNPEAIQSLLGQCDFYVIPNFLNIVNRLDESAREDTFEQLEGESLNGICAFAESLVQNNSMNITMLSLFDPETALGMVIASCEPYMGTAAVQIAVDEFQNILGAVGDGFQQFVTGEVEDICNLVEILIALGDIDEDQETLFNYLTETCEFDDDNSLELLTYATAIAGNVNLPEIVPDDFEDTSACDSIIQHINTYIFDMDDLDEDDLRDVQWISGAVSTCGTISGHEKTETDVLMLTMLIWSRWDKLSFAEKLTLLTAQNPCDAMVDFLDTGIVHLNSDLTEVDLWNMLQHQQSQDDWDPNTLGDTPDGPDVTPDHPTRYSFISRILSEENMTALIFGETDERQYLLGLMGESSRSNENCASSILNCSGIVEIPLNGDHRIAQPALSHDGSQIAYFEITDDGIWLMTGDVSNVMEANESNLGILSFPILVSSDLGEGQVFEQESPIVWSPLANDRLLVTVITNGVHEVYEVLVNESDREERLGADPLVSNATHPSFHVDGSHFVFTYLGEEDGSTIGIFRNADNIRIFDNPDELGDCYAPQYQLGYSALETLSFVFWCDTDDGHTLYARNYNQEDNSVGRAYSLGIVEGRFDDTDIDIDLNDVTQVITGPAENYLAFAYEGDIYFVYHGNEDEEIEDDRLAGVLIDDAGDIRLISISWGFSPSENR